MLLLLFVYNVQLSVEYKEVQCRDLSVTVSNGPLNVECVSWCGSFISKRDWLLLRRTRVKTKKLLSS